MRLRSSRRGLAALFVLVVTALLGLVPVSPASANEPTDWLVLYNPDGRKEIFTVGDGANHPCTLYHQYQLSTSSPTMSGWVPIGTNACIDDLNWGGGQGIDGAVNHDGHLEVFGIEVGTGRVMHIWQDFGVPGGWGAMIPVGNFQFINGPYVFQDYWLRVEGYGADGCFYGAEQDPNYNGGWGPFVKIFC